LKFVNNFPLYVNKLLVNQVKILFNIWPCFQNPYTAVFQKAVIPHIKQKPLSNKILLFLNLIGKELIIFFHPHMNNIYI